MTARRTHIVGAGIAGLSAALAVTAEGGEAVLYEAAPQPGGRCRTLHPADGFVHDNGTHVLFTANARALDLLKTIGARERWFEPEPKGTARSTIGRTGAMRRVGLSPWSWLLPSRRPHGLTLSDLARILRARLRVEGLPCGRHHRAASHHGQPDRAAHGGSAQHTCRAGLRAAARPGPAPAHPSGRRAAPGGAERPEPRPDRTRRRYSSGTRRLDPHRAAPAQASDRRRACHRARPSRTAR